MNKLILGMVMLVLLITFSAQAMADCCICPVATHGICPDNEECSYGTNGIVENGTVHVDCHYPCTNTFHIDFAPIPAGANVKWATLYWHIWMPGASTSATFCNGNNGCTNNIVDLSDQTNCYQDASEGHYGGGCGTSWVYWNVTTLATSGVNSVDINNLPAGDGRTMQCCLVVVYEKDGYPTTTYWVNNGYQDLGPGGTHRSDFNGPVGNTANGTLLQLGLCHNALVDITFNDNLAASTYGGGGCGYGVMEQYEIPKSWISTGGVNYMKWENIADDYHHPALTIFYVPRVTNIHKGGEEKCIEVRETWKIHQDKYDDYATDLHFKLWQKEDNIEVNGWKVEVSPFTHVNCERDSQPPPWSGTLNNLPGLPATSNPDNGKHAINVTADGATIPYCTWVTVNATFWLSDWNTKRISNITWTNETDATTPVKKAVPNHGWTVDWPTPDPVNPGQYLHTLTITNDDVVDTINVSGLAVNTSADRYEDLQGISYSALTPGSVILAPGASWSWPISTTGTYVGGHIYFRYSINESGGDTVVSTDWVDHPVVDNEKIIVLDNSDLARLVSEGRATFLLDTYYIEDQTITNSMCSYRCGIYIRDTTDPVVIDNCTVHDCGYDSFGRWVDYRSGICLANVTDVDITDCTLENNTEMGIKVRDRSTRVDIAHNTIYDNDVYGVEVGLVPLSAEDPTLVNISCNELYENFYGVELIGTNCIVKGNTVRDNGEYGIYVFGNDSKIYNNTVKTNAEYGIKLYNSSDNYIYWNDFIDNNGGGVQGYDAWLGLPGLALNTWNTVTQVNYCYNGATYTNYTGNYWDDYTGSDPDGDGIGNSAYALDGGSAQDSYPLMVQWRICGDVNRDGEVTIADAQKIYGSLGGSVELCNPWAADVNNCDGEVTIADAQKIYGSLGGSVELHCCCGGT